MDTTTLGAWFDGSGRYVATLTGDTLTVAHDTGSHVEQWSYTLTRTPSLDGADTTDYVLDSRIAIDSEPAGTYVGTAWVDGLAYGMTDVIA